jgi:hypothetical protein
MTASADESSRLDEMQQALTDAFKRPLTTPGSEARAELILSKFGGMDQVVEAFAKKALQTLDDGNMHSTLIYAPTGGEEDYMVAFVAWNGTHREVQAERIGEYLPALFGTPRRFVEMGQNPAGYFQIDAFVRMSGEKILADVEYSYLVGVVFGSSAPLPDEPLLRAVQVNPMLCTPEQRRELGLSEED